MAKHFHYQERDFTITTDDWNWILTWHKGGPRYDKREDRTRGSLKGRNSYFHTLAPLLKHLFNLRIKQVEGFEDLREKLPAMYKEIDALARLEPRRAENDP